MEKNPPERNERIETPYFKTRGSENKFSVLTKMPSRKQIPNKVRELNQKERAQI